MKSPSRLCHGFTPLRYPGGKAKLSTFVKRILRDNSLSDGHYVEPYAGGAGLALELLLHEYVEHVYLNDISRPIWAFWHSVLHDTEPLLRMIRNTRVTVDEWDKQKRRLANPLQTDDLKLGFATFFLSRTNRSGILNGGIIGGRAQTGKWKIDARYNGAELAARVEAIGNVADRISLSRQDALLFLQCGKSRWPAKTLIYLDPPYFEKGRCLYLDSYCASDHADIASLMQNTQWKQKWIVSYDDVPEINSLYAKSKKISYALAYSAREVRKGREVMFFSKGLVLPPIPDIIQKVNLPTREALDECA
jgi:DNA adenine methylase